MVETKLFKSGHSWAVRIPASLLKILTASASNTVHIEEVDGALLLSSDPWANWEDNLAKISDEYIAALEGIERRPAVERDY